MKNIFAYAQFFIFVFLSAVSIPSAAHAQSSDLVADVIGNDRICFYKPGSTLTADGCTPVITSNGQPILDILTLAPIKESLPDNYVRFAFLANGYTPGGSTDCPEGEDAPTDNGIKFGMVTLRLDSTGKIVAQQIFMHESCSFFFTSPADARSAQLDLVMQRANFSAYGQTFAGFAVQVTARNAGTNTGGEFGVGEIDFLAPYQGKLTFFGSRSLVVFNEKSLTSPVETYFDPVSSTATLSGGLTQCVLPLAKEQECVTRSDRNANGLLLPYTLSQSTAAAEAAAAADSQ